MSRFSGVRSNGGRRVLALGVVAALVAAASVVAAFAVAETTPVVTLTAKTQVGVNHDIVIFGDTVELTATIAPSATQTLNWWIGSAEGTVNASTLATGITSFSAADVPSQTRTYTAYLSSVPSATMEVSYTSKPVTVTVLPKLTGISVPRTDVLYGKSATLSVLAKGPLSIPDGFVLKRQELLRGSDGTLGWWSSSDAIGLSSSWLVKSATQRTYHRLALYSPRLESPIYSAIATVNVVPDLGQPRIKSAFRWNSGRHVVSGALAGPKTAKMWLCLQRVSSKSMATKIGKPILWSVTPPKNGIGRWTSSINAKSKSARGWWKVSLKYQSTGSWGTSPRYSPATPIHITN
jgi:hypothetical protein